MPLLYVVVSMSVPFLKPLMCSSDMIHVCSTHWPVWHLKHGLSFSSVLKVFTLLFTIISTHMWLRGEPWSLDTVLWGQSPELLLLQNLPGSFQFPGVLLSGQETEASFTLLRREFPPRHPCLSPSRKTGRRKNQQGVHPTF